jgi:predicted RNA-binding protein with PIN domain
MVDEAPAEFPASSFPQKTPPIPAGFFAAQTFPSFATGPSHTHRQIAEDLRSLPGDPVHGRGMSILIVDGHSMIFAWPDLRALHQRHQMQARERLCQLLRLWQDHSGERVVVVFDGKGPKITSGRTNEDDIQIIYAPSSETADTVIERLTARYAADHHLTIASDDRLVQTTISVSGGYWITSVELAARLQQAETELQRLLKKLRT